MSDELDISLFDDDNLFEINTDMLIEEWALQPRRMREAGKLLSQARKRVSKLKRLLKLKGAEITLDLLQDPKAYGVEGKTPNHVIEAVILTQDAYKELQVKLENAEYLAEQLDNAVVSLVDKRKGLENAVILHGQEYFADCREPGQKVDKQALGYGKGIKKKSVAE